MMGFQALAQGAYLALRGLFEPGRQPVTDETVVQVAGRRRGGLWCVWFAGHGKSLDGCRKPRMVCNLPALAQREPLR
ncbi:hypothetical protein D3C72_1096550 [compost metagenome]